MSGNHCSSLWVREWLRSVVNNYVNPSLPPSLTFILSRIKFHPAASSSSNSLKRNWEIKRERDRVVGVSVIEVLKWCLLVSCCCSLGFNLFEIEVVEWGVAAVGWNWVVSWLDVAMDCGLKFDSCLVGSVCVDRGGCWELNEWCYCRVSRWEGWLILVFEFVGVGFIVLEIVRVRVVSVKLGSGAGSSVFNKWVVRDHRLVLLSEWLVGASFDSQLKISWDHL